MTKNTHRSKPRLRRRRVAQPLGDVAAAGVGSRPWRCLEPHRRRDVFANDPEPCGRDPVPRARAVSTIALAFSFRPPLQQRGDSPAPACSCYDHHYYKNDPPHPAPRSNRIWSEASVKTLASVSLTASCLTPRHASLAAHAAVAIQERQQSPSCTTFVDRATAVAFLPLL